MINYSARVSKGFLVVVVVVFFVCGFFCLFVFNVRLKITMPVFLETYPGSTGDLQLGWRDKRHHLVWDSPAEDEPLDGHLNSIDGNGVTVGDLNEVPMLRWHVLQGHGAAFFACRPRRGKCRKCLLFWPGRVWEGRPVSDLSPGCCWVPQMCICHLFKSTPCWQPLCWLWQDQHCPLILGGELC